MLVQAQAVEDRGRGVFGGRGEGGYVEVRLADRAVIGWRSWQTARDYGCRYKALSRAGSSTKSKC